MSDLTTDQQQLIDKYYQDALKIGEAFKSSILHADEKENIAVMNLIRAARTYDPTRRGWKGRKVTFSTWLYTVIWTSLLNADKGVLDKDTGQYRPLKHKLPRTKLLSESIFSRVRENWNDDIESDFSSLFPYYDRFNEIEFQEMIEAVKARLDDRQKFIFLALLDPVGMGVPIKKSKKTLKVTMQALGSVSGISKQYVQVELLKIRSVVEHVLKNQDKEYFRIHPKEKDNG